MKSIKLLPILALFFALSMDSLAQDGAFDPTFDQGTGFFGVIYSMQVQTDDKIIVAGGLPMYNGVPISNIVRLNANGTLDTDFITGSGADDGVMKTILQPDGKILIAGKFDKYNDIPSKRIARINPDGSFDTTFNVGSGANKDIFALGLQADGKVLIGGFFTSFDGNSCNGIARLNADGSFDTSFNTGSGIDYDIYDFAIQPDGKIIIAGYFSIYNGTSRKGMARLNGDGSLDHTFNTEEIFNFREIRTVALQPDGKILAGTFESLLIRLNNDGSVDSSFNTGTGIGGPVFDILVQRDNKIIVTGFFLHYNGTTLSGLMRVNEDGSLDNSFDSGTGLYGSWQRGYSLVLQADNSLVLGGDFLEYDGHSVGHIVRTTNSVLNVDAIEKPAFSIYPNPTNGEVHFNLTDQTISEINIYNTKGQRLQSHKVSTTSSSLIINGLSGLYILEFCRNDGKKTYRKVIKL